MYRAGNRLVLAASGAAFAALAGLVASGTLNGFDQWACDHLMPLAGQAIGGPPSILESLVPLYHASWHPVGVAVTEVVTLPGQAVISFVLVSAGAWKLGERRWVVAWVAAVTLEFGIRHVLTRPALYRGGVHVTSLDSSWPSGHALRCAMVAAVLATAWPQARTALVAWLAATAVLLEIAGFHTPTDIAGGLLLALLACGAAASAGRARALRDS